MSKSAPFQIGRSMATSNRPAVSIALAAGRLSTARVFFGHQSVGLNLLDGLRRLSNASSDGLCLVDCGNSAESLADRRGFFAHARLGCNGSPTSKTAAFTNTLENGLAQRVDVAFHKYCYVDIERSTDVNALFGSYQAAMARLELRFPALTIVHVTTPVMAVQAGPRAIVKRLIGRAPDHYEDNVARNRFNELMRREYHGQGRLFDLAALEATPLGSVPETHKLNGEPFYSLRSEYTDDGGHLNVRAQDGIAAELARFLAATLDRHTSRAGN